MATSAGTRSRSSELDDEIRFGRDHEHLRVFVSSRMNGTLDAERKQAAAAIERLVTHRAWWWERDAPMGVLHSENECVQFAGTSDVLVLLVAGELSKIVLAEYAAAKKKGAERFIFIRKGVVLPADVDDFIERERKTSVTRNFQNGAELESLLYGALVRTSVRAVREVQLDRRRRAVVTGGSARRRG